MYRYKIGYGVIRVVKRHGVSIGYIPAGFIARYRMLYYTKVINYSIHSKLVGIDKKYFTHRNSMN